MRKIISTAIGPGASQKSEPKVDTTSIGNPMTLKLGINAHDVPLAGSPGSSVYNQGVQEGYRQPVNSQTGMRPGSLRKPSRKTMWSGRANCLMPELVPTSIIL